MNQRGRYRIQRENRGRPPVIHLGVPRQFRVTAYFSPSPPPSPHPKLHYVSSKLPHLPQGWSSDLRFAVSTLPSTWWPEYFAKKESWSWPFPTWKPSITFHYHILKSNPQSGLSGITGLCFCLWPCLSLFPSSSSYNHQLAIFLSHHSFLSPGLLHIYALCLKLTARPSKFTHIDV